jgi:hypothetical protein
MLCRYNIYCNEPSCNKYSSYGFLGEKPFFCNDHKLPSMICLKREICDAEGCEKFASYNYIGEKRGLYCQTHANEDMFNVKRLKTMGEPVLMCWPCSKK